jgi:hypothetical protein
MDDGRRATVDFAAGTVTIDGALTELAERIDGLPILAP